jgi:GntR family transcriptional regulator/MocR family aminotransferase
MRIPLNRQSGVPLYRQIETHLRQEILSGGLAAETRLPASRELAEELGVSRITIKNAYAELESDGLIASRQGSGTYVAPSFSPTGPGRPQAEPRWPLWQQEAVNESVFSNAIYPPMPDDQNPHLAPIRFTGVGDPRYFPVKDFLKAIQAVVRRDGVAALEYGKFGSGFEPLRQTIAHVLASQGVHTHPDQVLITSGSQQALALVCQALLKPGDTILVESPTYNLALELFRSSGLKIAGIPVDGHGMQVELLERLLQQYHPKLIYTIPNFHNPTGTCLSGTRRRALLELAQRYNVPILEDDYAGDLRYDGRAQPAIKALDPLGDVIYAGTFSKMLMPGLRLGFLVADGPIFRRLLHGKWVTDLTTSTLIQRTLDEYVTVGRYQAHLRRSCRINRARRDTMLSAMRKHLPREVKYDIPQGGLYIWLRLPEGLSALELLPLALKAGVEFTPGSWFFPVPAEGEGYLRLNFATQPPEQIEEGIRRLGTVMNRQILTGFGNR